MKRACVVLFVFMMILLVGFGCMSTEEEAVAQVITGDIGMADL